MSEVPLYRMVPKFFQFRVVEEMPAKSNMWYCLRRKTEGERVIFDPPRLLRLPYGRNFLSTGVPRSQEILTPLGPP